VTTPVVARSPEIPDYCTDPKLNTLQEVERTPAGPYFIHHPLTAGPSDPTVIFIPGGNSTRRGAQRLWDTYLSDGEGMEQFRLVVPYSPDETGFMGDTRLIVAVLDEVLACYGGDAAKVHIAGVSNGGRAAFDVMLSYPARFATLLGAPGLFPNNDAAGWARALGDRPVFNGVGANDNGWKPGVKATHDALVAEGVESVYVGFADQSHTVDVAFNEDIFFDFWTSH
jgi:predicted esterase